MPDNANFVAFVAAPISCLTPPSYAGILIGHFCRVGCIMSVALIMIVDGLVTLKDRQALEGLHEHRQQLREQLLRKRSSAFDPGQSIKLYETEVAVIESGLQKLSGSASA